MKLTIAIFCLLVPSLAMAQTCTTSSQFKWDAPSNAMDAADDHPGEWGVWAGEYVHDEPEAERLDQSETAAVGDGP